MIGRRSADTLVDGKWFILSFDKSADHRPVAIAKTEKLSADGKKYNKEVTMYIYTASKVKHHLNIFLEKTVKLSKYEFILVTCLKRDKVVTIYSNF